MTLQQKFMDAVNGNTNLTFVEKCALLNLFINYADAVRLELAEEEQACELHKAYGGIELLKHMGAIMDDEELMTLLSEIGKGGNK